jgi:hypothetical protein
VELRVLLDRLAELDKRRAVAIGRSLRLEPQLLAPLFTAWTADDPEAAIEALRPIGEAAAQRTLALAVLDALGNDAAGVARVARALPEAGRVSFEIDAIGRRAERDSNAALAAAAALKTYAARNLAIRRIAQAAAAGDPLAALDGSAGITDATLRTSFELGVLDAWARLEPLAALNFLDASVATDAASFATLERLPTIQRRSLERFALLALAETDPEGALARAEARPLGRERSALLQTLARTFARQYPEAAYAWVQSRPPSSSEALSGVLRGIAEVDFDRALGISFTALDKSGSAAHADASVIASVLPLIDAAERAEHFAQLANRLLSLQGPPEASVLTTVIGRWSRADSAGALSWVIANAERLDTAVLLSVARETARTDGALVRSMLERLPVEHRTAWVTGAAGAMAETDPSAALRFLEPFQDQPLYRAAYTSAVRSLAQRDPNAAAQHALSQREPAVRSAAVGAIAGIWARGDAEAAQRWTLMLPNGEIRDAAIDQLLLTAAASGKFATPLIAAYSNERARQHGVSTAIVQLGRIDVAQARALVDAHITEPVLRRQTEDQLARTGGSGRPGTAIRVQW